MGQTFTMINQCQFIELFWLILQPECAVLSRNIPTENISRMLALLKCLSLLNRTASIEITEGGNNVMNKKVKSTTLPYTGLKYLTSGKDCLGYLKNYLIKM